MKNEKLDLDLDCTKIAWHQERLAQWMRGEKFAPITIDIALTRACDYNCIYCYSQLQENKGEHLTFPIMKRFLRDCSELGVKGVSLVSDGESMLSPAYVPTIKFGASLGISMASATHGLHFKKSMAKAILPNLEYLRFNISAGESGEYGRIMGTEAKNFFKVRDNIKLAVDYKREHNLPVTIGMQMVLMPEYAHQIMPLARLAVELGVDYLVIKHCSDDEQGTLGVNYAGYDSIIPLLELAETLSTPRTAIIVKWSKITAGSSRTYSKCYGAPFLLQMSGSGLVAPCGCFFNEKYKHMHIGNIATTRFKDIVMSDKYWKVMNHLRSKKFDAKTMCGYLCVQHKTCEALDNYKKGKIKLLQPEGEKPLHVNFI